MKQLLLAELPFQLWLAALLLLSCIAVLVYAVVRLQRSNRQLDHLEAELGELRNSLLIYNEGAQGIGRRLVQAEHRLKSLVNDQAQLASQLGEQPYTEAARLVAQGLSVDEIVEQCSLSRAEVELMKLLNERQPVPPEAASLED